jgi:cell wall-associated NlpC family hydrolase
MTKLSRNYRLAALLPISLLQLAACSWQDPLPVGADDATVRISPTGSADVIAARAQAARTAAQMAGVPYRYGGLTPKGFDCSGLVYYSYRKAGMTVPRTSNEQFQTADRIDLDEARPGDLLFFARRRSVDHVAIYLGNQQFVHAPSSGKGVTIASMNDPYYRAHFVAAARFTVRDW